MFQPEDLGEVVDGHAIRFVRTIKHPAERVWQAITDESELTAWMRYPVSFEPREGGRVKFFSDVDGFVGRVFVFDPPRTLSYSFSGIGNPEEVQNVDRTWLVRWELEPIEGGCRLTFLHRFLGSCQLWGLGEGWHGFMDQLVAYFDGDLDALMADFKRREDAGDKSGLSFYRLHVTRQLAAWASGVATGARDAIAAGKSDDALEAIDRLDLAARQLSRIAKQEGAVPDYKLEGGNPTVL